MRRPVVSTKYPPAVRGSGDGRVDVGGCAAVAREGVVVVVVVELECLCATGITDLGFTRSVARGLGYLDS